MKFLLFLAVLLIASVSVYSQNSSVAIPTSSQNISLNSSLIPSLNVSVNASIAISSVDPSSGAATAAATSGASGAATAAATSGASGAATAAATSGASGAATAAATSGASGAATAAATSGASGAATAAATSGVAGSVTSTASNSVSGSPTGTQTPSSSATSTISATASITVPPVCGNLIVEVGEECDPGVGNFAGPSCCNTNCQYKRLNQKCGAAPGNCYKFPRCRGTATSRFCGPATFKRPNARCFLSGTSGAKGKCNGSGVCQ